MIFCEFIPLYSSQRVLCSGNPPTKLFSLTIDRRDQSWAHNEILITRVKITPKTVMIIQLPSQEIWTLSWCRNVVNPNLMKYIYRHVAFISVNEDLQESDNEKSYKSPLIFQDLSIWWMFTSRSIPPDQTLPHEIRLVIAYEDSK